MNDDSDIAKQAYRTGVVTFIDVLGFSSMVKTSNEPTKILSITNRLRSYGTQDLHGLLRSYGGCRIQFSDSVVRVLFLDGPGFRQSTADLLKQELEELTYAQGELFNEGVLIRGGVTIGKIYCDGPNIFGPAFIDAHELESKLAIFPRIILHREIIDKLRAASGEISESISNDDALSEINELTATDSDGFRFIDYLKQFPKEQLDEQDIALDYAPARQARITEELASMTDSSSSAAKKWRWLRDYHNRTVANVIKDEPARFFVP